MTNFIIRLRWWIIISCLVLGVAFAALIPFSKTDPEIRNYVPRSLDSRIRTDRIEKEFGTQDMVIILFSDSSVIKASDLLQIRETGKGLSKISGISKIISPFTVKTIKGGEGMMKAEPLVENIPSCARETEELKTRISANSLAAGIVFSKDLTTASITATINNLKTEAETLSKIDSLIAENPRPAAVRTGGLPYIRRYILTDVRSDALFIVPAALFIIFLILKLTLGDWKSVFMPFTVVVLSTAISIGLITTLGWKISIISLLVPVILVAVANNYGIYLVARHQEESTRWSGSNRDLINYLLGSLNMPILFSGLTAIAGILGLLAHTIIPARQVGVLAAAGVSVALTMSLLFIPALLYIQGPGKKVIRKDRFNIVIFDTVLNSLGKLITRHPGKVLLTSLIVTVLLSVGMIFLKTDTNQEHFFPSGHPVRSASDIINRKFGGSQTISVMISGDIKDPSVLKKIDNLTANLEKKEGIGHVFSISSVIREMTKAIFSVDEEGYDRIPGTREGVAQLFELYNMNGDQGDFDQLTNFDNTRAHVLVRLSNPSNTVIKDAVKTIEESLEGISAEVTVGGYAVIMSDFAGSIISGQFFSLLFAVVTVFILLALIFRSARAGLTGTIPFAASIPILFGFMGFTGIALDAATALLSSIMIGVGVDFTIQYMWCFNLELQKCGDFNTATTNSIMTIGRSIIINAFSVMAGFSALMLSRFTSIRFFGYLVFISIGACLIGAILVIPAFLLKFRPGFIEKDLSPRKYKQNEKQTDLVPSVAATSTGSSTNA